ncbi:hypothetical protein KYK29_03345 [Shinella daejeonensis]|uniref:hypothetical protein n=1 Tax=Shinella daejeonensis TaxID=659017 RepID=UPI0020C80335|nr:hypothetical protein [Shinella daejeonensis]MCP8893950.1 hypothetical protein [Shinella daejeonensis]
MARKPVLLTYINGMPDFESLYPVLAVLEARGRIDVRTVIYSKLLRKEPRLEQTFRHYGHTPVAASKLRMKFLFGQPMRDADAVLGIADPLWDTTTRKLRSKHVVRVGKPAIFLQHGAYQRGVNARWIADPMRFYSSLILFWEPLGENRVFFEAETAARIRPVGFTKQHVLPPKALSPELTSWMERYSRRLLICQSFRWGLGRFQKDHIDHFYDMVDTLLSRHPDLGIVIRSHRGKVRRNHRMHDRSLRKKHDNVMFSHQYSGPMKGFTIHDALDVVDGMISPVSTTVLDCLYRDKPTAVFAEETPLFGQLPQIAGLEDAEAFIESLRRPGAFGEGVLTQFGQLDRNLTRAAEEIETFLLQQSPGQA